MAENSKTDFVQGGNQLQTFILIGIVGIVLLFILSQVFAPKKDKETTNPTNPNPTNPNTSGTTTTGTTSSSGVVNPKYNSSNDTPATRTQQISFLLNLLGYTTPLSTSWTSPVESAFTRYRNDKNLAANPDANFWIKTLESDAINKGLLKA